MGGALGGALASPAGALFVPDCEEVRVSAAVARRGYLNVLQHGTHGWKKRWLVCTLYLPLCYLPPTALYSDLFNTLEPSSTHIAVLR